MIVRDRPSFCRGAVFIVWLGLLAVGSAVPARAADAPAVDPFRVSGVPVDATATSATAARETARLDGERRAFRLLLERLTVLGDHDRLPKLADPQISDLVRDFEVANERSSPVRYLANYTFRFRAEEIRRLLRNAGIPFAETISKPVVVVPVLTSGGQKSLWDDPNPWRDAWGTRPDFGGLVPLILPLGDVTDVAAIGADQALAADAAAMGALAQHYGTGEVLIAQAVLSDNGQTLQTNLARYSGGQPVGGAVVKSYKANAGETPQLLMARAVADGDAAIEEAWKSDNLLRFDNAQTITVAVPIGNLADWVAVRTRLAGVAAIQHSDLLSLSKEGAEIKLYYVGDPTRLRLALAQRDLVLTEGSPLWTLQPRAVAAQ